MFFVCFLLIYGSRTKATVLRSDLVLQAQICLPVIICLKSSSCCKMKLGPDSHACDGWCLIDMYLHLSLKHLHSAICIIYYSVCQEAPRVLFFCQCPSSTVLTVTTVVSRMQSRETVKGKGTQSGLQCRYIIVWMQQEVLFDAHYYHNLLSVTKFPILNIVEVLWGNPAQLVPPWRRLSAETLLFSAAARSQREPFWHLLI